jgi:hypothetical protein
MPVLHLQPVRSAEPPPRLGPRGGGPRREHSADPFRHRGPQRLQERVRGGRPLSGYSRKRDVLASHECPGNRVRYTFAPAPVPVPGVGELEAWQEGVATSLLEIPALRGLRVGTQKTLRWPGYAARVSVLRDLGLLSESPVEVDGSPVIPKRLVDAVLYPSVRLGPGEGDLALLRVEVIGDGPDSRPVRTRRWLTAGPTASRRWRGRPASRPRWSPA